MKRPPELQAMIDAITRDAEHMSIDELNRALADGVNAYNARSQADRGGLSPEQMYQLLYGDWCSTGALRVSDSLLLAELADIPFVADARMLLRYIDDAGAVKETAAKNLPRAVVAELLSRLRMPTELRHLANRPAPKNEQDVLWLPVLRHTLLFGGLLVRRKGLRLSPVGRELLADENAGKLFAQLFRTFFQKFDLRSLSRFDKHADLQSTIAYSFYRLQSVAREWTSPETLAQIAWLDTAKDPPSESDLLYGDLSHIAFRQRVLDPLVQFGLLEERRVGGENSWNELLEYRVSPLFGRALAFQFERAPARDIFLMQ